MDLQEAKDSYDRARTALEQARMNTPWWNAYLRILKRTQGPIPLDPALFASWKQDQQDEIRLNMLIVSHTSKEQQEESKALLHLNNVLFQLKN